MSGVELVNAEAVVGAYLRTHPAVVALEARVLGETPDSTDKPWVQVTLINPSNETRNRQVEWLVGYYLQLDCYAGKDGGQSEAYSLASAVRSALVAITTVELDDAVATDVEFLTMPRIPDTEFEPARQRYVLDAIVYMHPRG